MKISTFFTIISLFILLYPFVNYAQNSDIICPDESVIYIKPDMTGEEIKDGIKKLDKQIRSIKYKLIYIEGKLKDPKQLDTVVQKELKEYHQKLIEVYSNVDEVKIISKQQLGKIEGLSTGIDALKKSVQDIMIHLKNGKNKLDKHFKRLESKIDQLSEEQKREYKKIRLKINELDSTVKSLDKKLTDSTYLIFAYFNKLNKKIDDMSLTQNELLAINKEVKYMLENYGYKILHDIRKLEQKLQKEIKKLQEKQVENKKSLEKIQNKIEKLKEGNKKSSEKTQNKIEKLKEENKKSSEKTQNKIEKLNEKLETISRVINNIRKLLEKGLELDKEKFDYKKARDLHEAIENICNDYDSCKVTLEDIKSRKLIKVGKMLDGPMYYGIISCSIVDQHNNIHKETIINPSNSEYCALLINEENPIIQLKNKQSKWGFMTYQDNNNGSIKLNMIIDPNNPDYNYTEMGAFNECGVAIVKEGEHYGLIDITGREVIECAERHRHIREMPPNGFNNKTGQTLYRTQSKYGKYGLCDCIGNELLEEIYPKQTFEADAFNRATGEINIYMKNENKEMDTIIVKLSNLQPYEQPDLEFTPTYQQPNVNSNSDYQNTNQQVTQYNITPSPKKNNTKPILNSGNLHILAVGISKFNNHTHTLNLPYADKDAQDIITALTTQIGKTFPKVYTNMLLNKQATKQNIELQIKRLSEQVQPNDYAFIQFSTHGKIINEKNYYLTPTDVNIKDLAKTGISGHSLLDAISEIPCNVILVLDACYSGKFITNIWPSTRNIEATNNHIERGIHVGAPNKNPLRCIIASSLEDELSHEHHTWKNGILTEAILNAFENKSFFDPINSIEIKADYPDQYGTGILTIQELYNYVHKVVPILGKTRQQTDRLIRGGDMTVPFYQINKKEFQN